MKIIQTSTKSYLFLVYVVSFFLRVWKTSFCNLDFQSPFFVVACEEYERESVNAWSSIQLTKCDFFNFSSIVIAFKSEARNRERQDKKVLDGRKKRKTALWTQLNWFQFFVSLKRKEEAFHKLTKKIVASSIFSLPLDTQRMRYTHNKHYFFEDRKKRLHQVQM